VETFTRAVLLSLSEDGGSRRGGELKLKKLLSEEQK
jgi:hypothetical protein